MYLDYESIADIRRGIEEIANEIILDDKVRR